MWLLHQTDAPWAAKASRAGWRATRVCCILPCLQAADQETSVTRRDVTKVPTAAAQQRARLASPFAPLVPLISLRPGPRFGIPTDRHAACSHGSTPEVVSWHLAALHSSRPTCRPRPTASNCVRLRPGCRDERRVKSGETGQNSKAWRMVLIVICSWRSENLR